jgi:TetR/AcrR family transcriptional regulator, tetracycline repressor protein
MVEIRREPLNRRRILDAAVELVDREGLRALSMRRLGAELGYEAMSIYNHVPSKAALYDGMVEVLLEDLEIPPAERGWEERIRGAYRSFRRLALAHPNVFPLFVTRPPATPDGPWLVEEFLQTLKDAGFDTDTALHAFRTLSGYAFGYAMAEIRGFALEPDGTRSGAGKLSAERFPRITELSANLESVDRDAEFEFGLDVFFDGLRRRRRAGGR